MKTRILFAGIIFAILFMVPSVFSGVPPYINYQGVLLDSNGDPVTAPVSVEFSIYSVESGGSPIWNETRTVDPDASGGFSILLGESSSISHTVFSGADRWLGIKVESDPEMTPRLRFASVGYSNRVATVDGATGGVISGNVSIQSNLNVNGNITAAGKATIGPGNTNTGSYAFVAGQNNTANANHATVSGTGNTAGLQAAIGGGINNQATGQYSTVAGGGGNIANQLAAAIGGGFGNEGHVYSAIGGGNENYAGTYAAVGGGQFNDAEGSHSMIPGGKYNHTSGNYAFAAGYRAKANDPGSFVWADSYNADFNSGGVDEFGIRASGGTYIYSNGSLTAGVRLLAGASSWSSVCDRALKRNIRPVDGKEILAKLARIPISRWSYKAQDPSIEHIGPMAQDFYAAFGIGEDDRYIATIDADGIALAATKALLIKIEQLEARIAELEAERK